MRKTFTGGASLTTLSEMEKAMGVLFRFRADSGLERQIMLKVAALEDSEFAMCSSNTQKLGKIYQEFYNKYVADTRAINYYPMLDNIVSWMD
mmetsp:Transcript_1288/g.1736  ORF Transcript_1288/g.1736 Transcript_1288/m.1736 type:complete len:92 (+) Transcript_1288:443-718(+)|eukprot:CAMPEP_0185583208 /NCGR_PEP_ID=MMETSP0434-20130131/21383_1 /TAXON_ID=626734 ORGANISM="Favella taraikaensis, Strain Fe Narragansett Bay" /NCGR_SAMPLE_ID=MMETSP0434 /ASSEMBLY_ACC=CAM_ASM_000379 /LENGTH=91 /DNA_ID=CAMNT_0028202225 /DNA_START=437 /DNA_END=712 /DNA_ORIENTATION=-